jgi:hypothetical protein
MIGKQEVFPEIIYPKSFALQGPTATYVTHSPYILTAGRPNRWRCPILPHPLEREIHFWGMLVCWATGCSAFVDNQQDIFHPCLAFYSSNW